MNLDGFESVWFKLGMIIDTIKLYSLILVWLTLTVIEGHRDGRKQKLLCQVINQLDGIWYV